MISLHSTENWKLWSMCKIIPFTALFLFQLMWIIFNLTLCHCHILANLYQFFFLSWPHQTKFLWILFYIPWHSNLILLKYTIFTIVETCSKDCTSLNRTLNKMESCIFQTLYKVPIEIFKITCIVCLLDGVERHFQQYFSDIVAVSFIGGGNRRTRRKPPTWHKSLTNSIT
jgi:hypothetical protein